MSRTNPIVHALTCPIRFRWFKLRFRAPFWRDDKTAQMLGVAQYGCWRCGYGSIRERDASEGDER